MNMAKPEVNLSQLNWNQIWRESRNRRQKSRVKKRAYWNNRAFSFAAHIRKSGYATNFIRYLKPDAQWSVLDVGCGPGTLAIPMAERVKSVTAIDISDKMISILNSICRNQGISNVNARVLAWEDDWQAAGIQRHDVAIASRSLVMDDLEAAIHKLVTMARYKVVISSMVGDGPYDRRIFNTIGRTLDRGPDFLCVYNLLHQMGILADVTFVRSSHRPKIFKNMDEAMHGFDWMIPDMTRPEQMRLRDYLERHLIRHSDGWKLNHGHVAQWAVLSWHLSQQDRRACP